jgi:hypothetical protein
MVHPPPVAFVIEFTAGVPLVFTVKFPAVPLVKDVLEALVIEGATPVVGIFIVPFAVTAPPRVPHVALVVPHSYESAAKVGEPVGVDVDVCRVTVNVSWAPGPSVKQLGEMLTTVVPAGSPVTPTL